MFCSVFIEDKKLDSDLHNICMASDPMLLFTSQKKSQLLFCFRDNIMFARISRQMVCFSIKLEKWSGLIFFSRMHFVRVLSKEYHVIE